MHYSVESKTTDEPDIDGDLDILPARMFLVPDGATGEWTDISANRVAIRNWSLQLWSFEFLRPGDRVYVQDEEVLYEYTTAGLRRKDPAGMFRAYKNGAQTLTGSYADITAWNSPTTDIGDLASINTTTGVIDFLREPEGRLRIQVLAELLHTTGTQGLSCSVRAMLEPGDEVGFSARGEGYEAVIAAQPRKTVIIDRIIEPGVISWTDTASQLKIQGIHHSGTGAADIAAAETSILLTEMV